jgi:hypothetical protein
MAHGTAPAGRADASPAAPASLAATLRLQAEPAPIAARFRVSVTAPAAASGKAAPTRRVDWTYFRDAQRVALLKNNIDEIWLRDAQGRLSFERVFHDEQRVVDYSAGELATLGVQADWTALSSFVDTRELRWLKVTSRSGRGVDERIRLTGVAGGQTVTLDWLPALQLPARLLRTAPGGGSTLIELVQHATPAPASWPQPGAKSAGYLRLDAADFGDMEYEPVVRLSEALDVRGGWRSAHAHD